MKKLLSLIGAISIVGSGASAVISCGDFSKPKNDDQAKANAIKDKITNVNLTVAGGIAPGTKNAATIEAIKTALKSENPRLGIEDLAKISFADAMLQSGVSTTVKAIITVGTATAEKDLKVTLAKTDQQKANAIRDKITNTNLTVSESTNPDITNANTIEAIKTALQSENDALTADDLSAIGFTGDNLQSGVNAAIKANIQVKAAKAEKDLNVKLAQTDQEKADAIKDKITDDTLDIPVGTNVDTTNPGTIREIKTVLATHNTDLTPDDLMKISFASATLRPFTSVTVVATITVGSATATVNLDLTIAATDQQKADRIKNKIIDVNLSMSAGTNPDTTNAYTIALIKTALQTANSALTIEDLATISFSDTTLQAGTPVTVTATITVDTAKATKDLNVTLAQSDQQQADAIKAKINDVDLTVPPETNPDTTASATVDAIKVVLEAENVSLSASDLNDITFSDTTLQKGSSTPVIAIITVGSATATKDLNVTLAQSDQEKANAIRDKITNVDLTVPVGTDPDTNNAATITAIKSTLEAENPTLTTADVGTITLATTTLQAGTPVTVTATITVGTATATKVLNVTLAQTPAQEARAILDKIANANVSVPPGTDPDTRVVTTVNAIRDALQNARPTLTNEEKNRIIFDRATLQPGISVNVDAAIIVRSLGRVFIQQINVTLLAPQGQQKANAIRDKISDDNLFVVPSTNVNTNNNDTTTAIKTALKSQNQSLTTDDMSKIALASTTLQAGTSVVVKATITVEQATVEKDLNVTLAKTDQQQANAIQQKISYLVYYYGWYDTNPAEYNTSDADLRLRMRYTVQNQVGLTDGERNTISLEQGVQLITNTPVDVVLTITVGGMTATTTITITFIPI